MYPKFLMGNSVEVGVEEEVLGASEVSGEE